MTKLEGIVSEIPYQAPPVQVPIIPVSSPTTEKGVVYVFSETLNTGRTGAYIPAIRPFPKLEEKKSRTKRFILGMTISLFLLGSAVLGLFPLIGDEQDRIEAKVEWVVVQVEQGDTIWDLVRKHEGSNNHDIRELVEMVKTHNNLQHASLQIGMKIEMPVFKEEK